MKIKDGYRRRRSVARCRLKPSTSQAAFRDLFVGYHKLLRLMWAYLYLYLKFEVSSLRLYLNYDVGCLPLYLNYNIGRLRLYFN